MTRTVAAGTAEVAGSGGGPGARAGSTVGGGGKPAAGGGEVVLLGVRHHGPGSARAVRAALDARQPQAVLIEGPPEADALAGLAADPAMRPPVALLAHVVDDPAKAGFWPFAEFSPEWVALQWAAKAGAEVRFIDLPAACTLAPAAEPDADADAGAEPDAEGGAGTDAGTPPRAEAVRVDPLAVLAGAAGYDDPERWWEDAVEHRGGDAYGDAYGDGDPYDPLAPFAALAEAMAEIRASYGDAGEDERDRRREAHMRLRIREARRTYARTAVVCGAWHVPALAARTTAAADKALLKGLPKARVETTWVPWTHRRLARASGYGAGIDSPGWYRHLFTAPDRPVTRWMTKVAGLLREEDLPVSSAHVIEAVRLADTLASMRGRPLAGLGEATDATRAVMCDGSDVPLALIHDRLVVGDLLGEVPPDAPAVPLARDLAREQRRLRLKPEALEREVELDLRKDTDAGRSRLLHRLRLLGIDWGEPAQRRASTGTFRETWRLRWEPEAAIRVAEAGIWGTTVESAATARAEDAAARARTLADVTAVAEQCLLGGLSRALPAVMRMLADRAALDADVSHLADALPALVRAVRYGDVRGTDSAALTRVARGLARRICVGFPAACVGLDADAARELRARMDTVHRAIALLPNPEPSPAPETTPAPPPVPVAGSAPHPDRVPEGDPDRSPASDGVPGGPAAPDRGAASALPTARAPEGAPGRSPASGSASGGGAASPASAPHPDRVPEGDPDRGPVSGSAPGGPAAPERGAASALPTARAPEGDPGRDPASAPAPDRGAAASPASAPPPDPQLTSRAHASADADAGEDLRSRWAGVLGVVARRDESVPGVLRGAAARLLLDEGRLDAAEAARLMGLALSAGTEPAQAAAWIEGFLAGSGMLLVHDERLLALVDGWLSRVSADAFTDVLPLLRRTFAELESGVRRSVGELVRRGPAVAVPRADRDAAAAGTTGVGLPGFGPGIDRTRADAAAHTVRLLLGTLTTTDLGEQGDD